MDKISKKVVVVGEPSTGKSALVQLYCSDGKEFPKEYHMTQVTEIASKISELEGDKDVELIFFDIGGKEIYRNAASKMVKQADFCVLVYDCTNPESFTALDQWSDFVKKANNNKLPKGLLVSTKNDLQSLKKITEEQGKRAASKFELEFHEFDYKEYDKIDAAFETLAKLA